MFVSEPEAVNSGKRGEGGCAGWAPTFELTRLDFRRGFQGSVGRQRLAAYRSRASAGQLGHAASQPFCFLDVILRHLFSAIPHRVTRTNYEQKNTRPHPTPTSHTIEYICFQAPFTSYRKWPWPGCGALMASSYPHFWRAESRARQVPEPAWQDKWASAGRRQAKSDSALSTVYSSR